MAKSWLKITLSALGFTSSFNMLYKGISGNTPCASNLIIHEPKRLVSKSFQALY